MGKGAARCLRLHADYLCRHAGACCTAGWAIPVERAGLRAAQRALRRRGRAAAPVRPRRSVADGRGGDARRPAERRVRVLRGGCAATSAPSTASSARNGCRRRAGSFPASSSTTRAGRSISLSHFCPTAAGLLQSLRPPGVRDRRGARDHRARRRGRRSRRARSAAAAPAAGDAHRSRGLRCVGTAGDRRARARRPHRRAGARSAGRRHQGRAVLAAGCSVSLRETVDREFDVASAGKPDKDLDGIVARVRLALGSVPEGLPCPAPVDGFRSGVAGRLPVVGRVRWCGPRLSRGAPLRKLGRVLRSGPARDRGVPAGRPGRREDGSRAAPRVRSAVINMADRQTKPFEAPISCSCTCRTQELLSRRLG